MSKRKWLFANLLVIGTLPWLMGHGGGGCGGDEDSVFGPPTQATCPQGSTLTFENFGKAFMEQYCTRCHSSALTGSARNGAPKFHDFDTVGGVRSVRDHVDQTAAGGPSSLNTSMPPSAPIPSEDERRKLGEWLACEAP